MQLVNRSFLLFVLSGISVLCALELNGKVAAWLFLLVALILTGISMRREYFLSPAMLVIAAYALAYPLEVLFYDFFSTRHWIRLEDLEFSTLWALRGFCAFGIGYSIVLVLFPNPRRAIRRDVTWIRGRISYTIYLMTAIGWLVAISWVLSVALFGISLTFVEGEGVAVESAAGTFQQVLGLVGILRQPFLLGFLILYYWRLTDRHLTLLFWVLVGITVVEIVTIGSKASIIRGVVIVLLAGAILPMRLSFRQAAAGAVALLVFYVAFLVITEYRVRILNDYIAGLNVFDITVQTEAFGEALLASAPFADSRKGRETEVKAIDVFSRLSHATTFSDLLEHTGRIPPYEHIWESFLAPVYAIVPRVLLPDKPEFFHSGRNASEYYGWRYGGISVTLLGSLYFAWGYVGLIVGMACMGGWLALVETKARDGSILSPHWLVLLVLTVLMLMDVGVTFQPILTDLVRVTLVLWTLYPLFLVLKAAMRRRSARILAPAPSGWHA